MGVLKRPRTSDPNLITEFRFEQVAQHIGLEAVDVHKRSIRATLEEFAPDVPHEDGFSITHLLLLVWAPLLRFAKSAKPESVLSEDLKKCQSLIAPRLSDVLGLDMSEAIDIDSLLTWMAGCLGDFLGVFVDSKLIRERVGKVVPFCMDATYLTGITLIASGALEACLGPTLTSLAQRKAVCWAVKVDLAVPPAATLSDLISETLESRMPKGDDAPPAQDFSKARDLASKSGWRTSVQSMVELAVKTKQALTALQRPSLQPRTRSQLWCR